MGVLIKSYTHEVDITATPDSAKTITTLDGKTIYCSSVLSPLIFNDVCDLLTEAGFNITSDSNNFAITINNEITIYAMGFGTSSSSPSTNCSQIINSTYHYPLLSIGRNISFFTNQYAIYYCYGVLPSLKSSIMISYRLVVRYNNNSIEINILPTSTSTTTQPLWIVKGKDNISSDNVYIIYCRSSEVNIFKNNINTKNVTSYSERWQDYSNTAASNGCITSIADDTTAIVKPATGFNGAITYQGIADIRTKSALTAGSYYKVGEKVYWYFDGHFLQV